MAPEKEIIKMNKVLAEFMGAEFSNEDPDNLTGPKNSFPYDNFWRCSFNPECNFSWLFPTCLDYHENISEQFEVMNEIQKIHDGGISKNVELIHLFNDCHQSWNSLDMQKIHVSIYNFANFYLLCYKK